MTTDLAVSMDELELESAELLPSRETLCAPRCCSPCGGGGLLIGVDVNVFVGVGIF
jgi:hypothetical protein